MNDEDNRLRISIDEIFQLTPGASGEITLFDCIYKDFFELAKVVEDLEELKDAVFRISIFLSKGNRDQVEIDRYQLGSLPFTVVRPFVTIPPLKTDKSLIPLLRCIRGSILIGLMKERSTLSRKLAETLRRLFDGSFYQFTDACNSLHEFANLIVDAELQPDLFRLISRIQSILRAGFSMNLKVQSTIIVVPAPSSVSIPVVEIVVKPPKRFYTAVHQDGDLLAYLVFGFKHANARDASGVINQYKSLNNAEIVSYFRWVIEEYRKTKSETLLAIMLSFHLRVGPAHFNLVRFEYSEGHNVWIDLDNGYLCWNRLAFVNGFNSKKMPAEQDIFYIPLPFELVSALKELYALKGGSKLGDIFGNLLELRDLKLACLQYAFSHNQSMHKPLLNRISRGIGRFIFQLSQDDVYASVISLDFTISTQSSFYYFVSDPDRINSICREAYAQIGYVAGLYKETSVSSGPIFARLRVPLIKLLQEQLMLVIKAFSKVHAKSKAAELIEAHEIIALGISTLITVVMGLRRAKEFSICAHTLDLLEEMVLIRDKASTDYLNARLLPIPKILKDWLTFYLNWLSRLANRNSQIGLQTAVKIKSLISQQSVNLSSEPLFFVFRAKQLEPIGSRHLDEIFQSLNLPVNVGRHVMDFELRNICHSALVNLYMGHANLGQETFGLRSGLSVSSGINELKIKLDLILEGFNLPDAPQIKSADLSKLDSTRGAQKFSPHLWKSRNG